MKKIFLIILILISSISVIGQTPATGTYWKVANLTQRFGRALSDSSQVYVKSNYTWYQLTRSVPSTMTMQKALDSNYCVLAKAGDAGSLGGHPASWFTPYSDSLKTAYLDQQNTFTRKQIFNYPLVFYPSVTPTPEEGLMYYNSTTHTWMGFNGTAWVDIAGGSNTNFQGLAWNEVTDTYVRQGTLAGQAINASPGDLLMPVQSKMKGCVMTAAGTVSYYLSATDWNYKANGAASVLTGSDGHVMVEIPKFYIQYQKNGNYHIWNISIDSIAGFTRHPAFIKDGTYVNYRYIGAYEAVLWDATTDSSYRDYRAGVTITSASDKLTSVSGRRPVTNFTRASGRAMAARIGTGWRQMDFDLANAVEWLILIEYGSFYIQNIATVGPGITNVADWAAYNNYYPFNRTGSGNAIGNASGDNAGGATCVADTNKYSKYRGIENFYGHIYKFIDGINILDNHPYVTNNSTVWADNTSTGYYDPGVTLSPTNGYQKTLVNSSRVMLPASVGGTAGSSTFITDYYYQSTGWRIAVLGGCATYGAIAGPWSWSLTYDSGYSLSYFGSRVAF